MNCLTDAPFNRPACFNIEGAIIIDSLYDTKEKIAFRAPICPLFDALHGITSHHHVVLLRYNSVLQLAKATWELAFWPKKATVLFEIPTIRDVFLVARESHQPPTTNHQPPTTNDWNIPLNLRATRSFEATSVYFWCEPGFRLSTTEWRPL